MKVKDSFPKLKGIITITKREDKTGKVLSIHKYRNVFCDSGKLSILRALAGDNTKGVITYLALGDSTTAPAKTDVKLGNELYRHGVTLREASGLTFSSSTFIPSTEGNGTYKEMGLFGDDATGTKDSGTLFTHLAINETKSSGESMTVDYDIVAS